MPRTAEHKTVQGRILVDPQEIGWTYLPCGGAEKRRCLDRAVREGRILRDGASRKNAPYRYCLPAKAEAWRADPIHPDNLAAWFKSQGAEPADGETAEE